MRTTERSREARLRRMASRQNLTLQRSRRRDEHATDYGGYMLVDPRTNTVVAGGSPQPYFLSLDDVEQVLGAMPKPVVKFELSITLTDWETDPANALQTYLEIGEILDLVKRRITNEYNNANAMRLRYTEPIADHNGNTVGAWAVR